MNQKQLIKIAAETIDVCEKGFYINPLGNMVVIEDELDDAMCDSDCYFENISLPKLTRYENKTKISFSEETTAVAGKRLYDTYQDAAILNFASAKNPGGGFLHGAKAQEEDLCRVSGLYSCLESPYVETYYDNNKIVKSSLYTDGVIYSPKVPFFRDDNYSFLEEPFYLSVITCPAPNLNGLKGLKYPIADKELSSIFEQRIEMILSVMHLNNHKHIVLGAWGCGAFGNDPKLVAKAFHKELKIYQHHFDNIVFAIPDVNSQNHLVFKEVFK